VTTLAITEHAKRRRKQMGVTEAAIAQAVIDPELSYPSPPDHPPGRTLYQRGPIVVVVENATNEIVTVLWHRKEGRS
jgi:hypothetical protein